MQGVTSPMDTQRIPHPVLRASGRDEGVALALDAIVEVTGTTGGTVHVLAPGAPALQLVASRQIPDIVLDKVRVIPVGKGMAGVAVEQRRPVTTCNLQTDDAGGVIRQGARE